MSVLICKNVPNENPGTIEDYLKEHGISHTVVEMSQEHDIPDTDFFDTLIILGGPMSANESDKYSYLKTEMELIRKFILEDKKILGICLGCQLIAKTLGAKVYKGPEDEFGWYNIELTDDGIRDQLMMKLAVHPRAGDIWKKFKIFQWHGETFDIPNGAARIAKSNIYPNQAFKYGKRIYAFQFHIELRKETINEWLKSVPYDPEKARIDTEKLYEIYQGRAYNFYKRFFDL